MPTAYQEPQVAMVIILAIVAMAVIFALSRFKPAND